MSTHATVSIQGIPQDAGSGAAERWPGCDGTPLDAFGMPHMRCLERAMIDEYEKLLAEISTTLTAANHAVAVELARIPNLVRGYKEVRARQVGRYRTRMAELRAKLQPSRLRRSRLLATDGGSRLPARTTSRLPRCRPKPCRREPGREAMRRHYGQQRGRRGHRAHEREPRTAYATLLVGAAAHQARDGYHGRRMSRRSHA